MNISVCSNLRFKWTPFAWFKLYAEKSFRATNVPNSFIIVLTACDMHQIVMRALRARNSTQVSRFNCANANVCAPAVALALQVQWHSASLRNQATHFLPPSFYAKIKFTNFFHFYNL